MEKDRGLVTLLKVQNILQRLKPDIIFEITLFLKEYSLILEENRVPKSQHKEILNRCFVNHYSLSVKEFEVIYSQFIIEK